MFQDVVKNSVLLAQLDLLRATYSHQSFAQDSKHCIVRRRLMIIHQGCEERYFGEKYQITWNWEDDNVPITLPQKHQIAISCH